MTRFLLSTLILSISLFGDGLKYEADGQLVRPDYREWVFLGSGLGMTYGPAAELSRDPKFDTVFVSPASWKVFRETGKWPDKTVFILEVRASTSQGSINKAGFYPTDIVAIEAAVKDTERFPGNWGYFDFGKNRTRAKVLGKSQSCYACHATNAAVENSFVQFYPAALEIATRKGTLNPGYRESTARR
jgi:hypothetical protein